MALKSGLGARTLSSTYDRVWERAAGMPFGAQGASRRYTSRKTMW